MGIDPVTHETLNKEATSQNSSSPAEHLSQVDNINIHQVKENGVAINSEENSTSSPAENSSGEESLLMDSICSDVSLMNSMWLDETPLMDTLWDTTPKLENEKLPMWEDNCSWLLDCQDFGIHDFDFNCSSEIESNALQTLDLDRKEL